MLIENMGETVDPVLAPIVSRATFKKGRSLYVKLVRFLELLPGPLASERTRPAL